MADAPEALRSRLPVWAMLAGALILGLGLAGAGFLIGRGFEHGRSADRYVTVKGLAESFVTADLAVWPLRITATGDDLARVQEQIDRDLSTVTRFLTEQGIEPEGVQPQRVEVTDLLAQPYRPEGVGANRFIVAQTTIVRTGQVDRVARLNQQTGELVKRGVVLADTGGPTYLFTRLNEIKPELLAEATRNARLSAEQFAAEFRQRDRRDPARLAGPVRDPAARSRARSHGGEPGGQEDPGGQYDRVPAGRLTLAVMAGAELRSPERLGVLGPCVGPGQADVAQHVIAERTELAALARPVEPGQPNLGNSTCPLAEPVSRIPGQRQNKRRHGRLTRLYCVGTILRAHRLHPCWRATIRNNLDSIPELMNILSP